MMYLQYLSEAGLPTTCGAGAFDFAVDLGF
jgi:hypothetical protein